MKSLIEENAKKINELMQNINITVKNRNRFYNFFFSIFYGKNTDSYNRWQNACKEFHENYDRLAFIGGLNEGLEKLSRSDPDTIENAIVFLEVNPYFFRSGYIKEKVLPILKRIPLSKEQIIRLQNVILHIIDNFYCREFLYYCRLGKKVSSKDFIEKLEKRSNSNNSDIRKRADLMKTYLE